MSDKRDQHKSIVIDTPHVPPTEAGPRDAESRAVASHPEFQALMAEGSRNRAAGKGLSAAEVFDGADADSELAAEAAPVQTPHGAATKGESGRLAEERAPTKAAGG